jgi:cell wall-associated NlpC family hydrolase
MRFALLALVLCAALVAGARHASAAPTVSHAETRSTVVGARAVEVARRWLGVRYTYGGTSPRSGFDCSGFVRFVYDRLGFDLPHSSYAQFDLGRRVARKALRPGDLVFFDGLGHVGIYVGANRFIHAPNSRTRVSVDSMSGWYAARYDGARRLA